MNRYFLSVLALACLLAVCSAKDEKSGDSMAPLGKCADWCTDHCKSECSKKGFNGEGVKADCKSERQCNCECPAASAKCSTEFCDAFCAKNSNGRKLSGNKCKDDQTCQCKFESS